MTSSHLSDAKIRSKKAHRLVLSVTPANASKILGHHRYWTPEFAGQYLDRCELERFGDPGLAWALVREVPRLLNLMLQIDRPWPDFDVMALTIRGLGLVGEIGSMVGNWKVAEDAFRQANHWMRQGRVSESSAAELMCRHGSTLLRQDQVPEAIDRLEASLRLHRGLETPDETRLAETLLLLGWVTNSRESRRGLAEVLVRVPPKGILEQCLFESALSRLLDRRLLRQLSTSDASTIAGWIDVAAKRWLRLKSKTLHRPLLRWLEGLMLSRIWMDGLSQRRMDSAWQGLSRLGQVDLMVLVGLDLALLSLGHGDPETSEAALSESRERVRRLTGDPELKNLLIQLENADREVVEKQRDSLYESLARGLWSYPVPREVK